MTQTHRPLQIFTLNIGNPSLLRAERQLQWLAQREEDVIVLTETAASRGCELIAARLYNAGWEVRFPQPPGGERGVLIASRVRLLDGHAEVLDFLPARAQRILIERASLEVVGAYVPSRDASASKTFRKRRFLERLLVALAPVSRAAVLIGDLNIIEPNHRPPYTWLHQWEYDFYEGLLARGWVDAYRLHSPVSIEHSWVGYDGDGYRYDHTFVSANLAQQVLRCGYIHETRELELTDHSGMSLALELSAAEPLEVSSTLQGEQPALF